MFGSRKRCFADGQTLARGRAIPAFGAGTRHSLAGEERFAVLIFLDYMKADKGIYLKVCPKTGGLMRRLCAASISCNPPGLG